MSGAPAAGLPGPGRSKRSTGSVHLVELARGRHRRTKPRMASLCGTNGLALIRAIDLAHVRFQVGKESKASPTFGDS